MVILFLILERLHLEQQGAVKMKCWRRNKTQKKLPEPKRPPNKKLTSNVLLESLSMLDLPKSSTSDSIPSSSTSPVLSDVNMHVTQEIPGLEGPKPVLKTPRSIKSRKVPIQTMQTTDNAVELNIGRSKIIDQGVTETSKLFAMPVSNNISTVTTNNSPIITASNMACQSIASTNLKVINTQTVVNSGQIINITQNVNSNNQKLVNNNKMIVNSISTNVSSS